MIGKTFSDLILGASMMGAFNEAVVLNRKPVSKGITMPRKEWLKRKARMKMQKQSRKINRN